MFKSLSLILFLVVGIAFNSFSQNILLQKFQCADFELHYPVKWTVDTADNQYAFYYSKNLGEIRISVYASNKSSAEELKQTVLAIKEKKEAKPDITTTENKGELTIEYRYREDHFVTCLKVIQNDKNMYFLSLYWKEDSWDEFKDLLTESVNSFKYN